MSTEAINLYIDKSIDIDFFEDNFFSFKSYLRIK